MDVNGRYIYDISKWSLINTESISDIEEAIILNVNLHIKEKIVDSIEKINFDNIDIELIQKNNSIIYVNEDCYEDFLNKVLWYTLLEKNDNITTLYWIEIHIYPKNKYNEVLMSSYSKYNLVIIIENLTDISYIDIWKVNDNLYIK